MADDAYSNLENDLSRDGIRCQFQTPGQFVISYQVGPIWPDRGNSFWVTHIDDHWYLFTWAPVGYQLAEAVRIADLCRAFIAHKDRVAFVVPDVIIKEFNLSLLSEDDADAVYRAMAAA